METIKQVCRDAGHFVPSIVGAVVVLAASCHHAMAWNQPANPEIDPGSVGSAITLFVGGAMYLTSRRRAK